MHKYTQEQINYLVSKIPGRSYRELIYLFYKRFEVNLSISQIKSFIGNRKLSTGRTGRFEKGNLPFNKGQKGLTWGGKETQFKKGNKPHNYLPVGTERVNGDGYVDIKIEDPNKWKAKHRIIWEEHNGTIPKGHAILFGDGNNRNFDINNLILVSLRQLHMLNQKNLIKNDADLTRSGLIIADLYTMINQRKKKSI